ncbi:MAG: peptidyl-tRNA hydrolase Pth2 [Candidatus Nanoarchaeia archaeon]
MGLKQVILIRHDLKLPKGKMAAQSAHAAVEAVLKSDKEKVKTWRQAGSKKVTLRVESKEELYKYAQTAKDDGITTAIITDAGRTVIEPGTVTCAALGPDNEEKIDKITKNLKMI